MPRTPPPIRPSRLPGTEIRPSAPTVEVAEATVRRLASICTVELTDEATADAAQDWWPLALVWAHHSVATPPPAAVARPEDADQVSQILRVCNETRTPVTTVAGRSGVTGGAIALHGGVALDTTGLSGVVEVRHADALVDVATGTFGDELEAGLRLDHRCTVGHWPQSIEMSTVGGWLACRSAGQLSNRYGKIEDIVAGLDVVLADGTIVRTDAGPRAATGPDLTQLFVGSEGVLGVITSARLRTWPLPASTARSAYGFDSFDGGIEVCRRLAQRGLAPAVLRLHDAVDAARNLDLDTNLLLALDEGDPLTVRATMSALADLCEGAATRLDPAVVDRWLEHRNDVDALGRYVAGGAVVDTMEVAAPWSSISRIYEATIAVIGSVQHTLSVSAHLSHSYRDGACLYFTFGGLPPADEAERYYVAAWDAGTRAVIDLGGTLSHHHGIGLNRARFVSDALGERHAIIVAVKKALDPSGILNPGKLGLPDPFGAVEWP